jgi:mannose-6-phosphate isomerase-like protein (cupin superfamily)
MSTEMPYTTVLEPRFGALELIDVPVIARAVTDPWYNATLCQVNDAVIRLGVVKGEYHWHHHDAEDEFFYVVDGELIIELEDRRVSLRPGQALTVPKGLRHRPLAPLRTIVLMVEQAGIQPTGS